MISAGYALTPNDHSFSHGSHFMIKGIRKVPTAVTIRTGKRTRLNATRSGSIILESINYYHQQNTKSTIQSE